ncbi:MAG: hypothetical protein JST39_02850, partial [Bacteroidetes bacterium]|nr:hypothetical protein [Bacteroidota bacterium]
MAITAFVVLGAVQFFLLFNMYRMEDEHYYEQEKKKLHDAYEPMIRNDKLYPGAVQIVDRHVYQYMDTLGVLYKQHRLAEFDRLSQQMCDSMFAELRAKNCGDSVMRVIKEIAQMKDSLEYVMMISDIGFAFEPREYVSIYTPNRRYPAINRSIQENDGIRIAGNLKRINTQNSISSLTVSSPLGRSYKMSFSLHVDTPGRLWAVIRKTLPVFLLSLFSIFLVLVIFFLTFRNWLKQKKVSEMQSDFINNITHEFHTPLSAIMVANKSLQNDRIAEKKENIESLTGVIGRQSVRLRTLIGQVIDVSVGRMVQLNKTSVSLNELLDDVLL